MAQFFKTKDGSPSLYDLANPSDASELMHAQAGAYSETEFVFHPAINKVIENEWPQRFQVVGLGLGYIEFAIFAHLLSGAKTEENFSILSFESQGELRENLLAFFLQEQMEPSYKEAYEWILLRYAKDFSISPEDLFEFAKMSLVTERWQIQDALTDYNQAQYQSHCILFDAFSQKTSPQLWTEDFLTNFLQASAQSPAVFASYAATGNLKRALANNGFEIQEKSGFSTKRESTFALKINA